MTSPVNETKDTTEDAKAGTAESANTPETPVAATRPPPRRRWISWLLLPLVLLGLAALGAMEYRYVLRMQHDIARLQAEQVAVHTKMEAAASNQQATLDALTKTQQQQRQILNDIVSVDRTNWMLAEAEYLARMANQRLLVSRDISGALELLESADSLLAGVNDGSMLVVRQALAGDVADLKLVAPSDGEGLYTRIESLIAQTAYLQSVTGEHAAADNAALVTAPEAASATAFTRVQAVLAKIGIYLERSDVPVRIPLTRKESELLRQNLRLMLEQAQLALMQRDAQVYHLCLTHASEWISQYFAPEDKNTQVMLTELKTLSAVELKLPLPDITQSLTALHDEIRKHYAQLPSAPVGDIPVPASSGAPAP